jgi:hypothetical protein
LSLVNPDGILLEFLARIFRQLERRGRERSPIRWSFKTAPTVLINQNNPESSIRNDAPNGSRSNST